MEWKEVRLGDVCEIKGGKRLPKGVNLITQRNSHPYIRVRDLGKSKTIELNSSYEYVDEITQKQIQRYITQKGDILISIVGTIGLIAIVGDSLNGANLTENCVKLVKLDNIDSEYLYYYLKSPFGQQNISRGTVGAVQAKLPIKNIQEFSINCPKLVSDQRRIASILSSLDRKIELNNKINADLEEMAQAIFKNWFVDFEPFKNGKFVNSELGMIPEGWKVGCLGDIAEITSGKRPPKKSKDKTKELFIPLIGASDIMGFTSDVLYERPILVIGRVGTHGVVQRFQEKCWPSDNTLVIESRYYNYVYQLLKGIDYSAINRGSTQPLITQTDVKNTDVIIAPENVLKEYESITSTLFSKHRANIKENSRLSLLRDTLLPRLMSGELEVPE
ncbi:restriction endonuclease subunit S [Segatella copri]|uniref:restriction endonuclease subunit S n=1 Tax=Segatella copri TaxID=165179 RepID=UPI001290F0F3|nr:restriction endonuclease subunit S [Segatella copri]MQM50151.1 restriction endonuclease subunit S [Segatella copri]MQM67107.1 restriction endonuclease subunit S [Segatella copri]MQM93288.1 restriction endonuclease subunit S [Segatella copri]MQM99178.1 restriction endonuclease subunit S [Segatella copri]MQN95736.1 restriction endonuclease subunit S [Segatella copri]